MNKKAIGEKIRSRRKALKVDQSTLAALSEISVNTLVAIERGDGNPKMETLLRILDVLGLAVIIDFKP